ncbi:MAG: glutamine synthetase III [Kiritimatiellia bacterium]
MGKGIGPENRPDIRFGEQVFSIQAMRNYLSEASFRSLSATILQGRPFDPAIADEVAGAMKNWALERGATHYTHWFQPLTGMTAEKHDAFFVPDHEGGVIARFSGSELRQSEPDASAFPNGGLRMTFEARGYTAWDPTSPAFLKKDPSGATVLCIPTAFCGYHGDALDKKTPLLRSQNALYARILRLAKLFGVDGSARPRVTLGVEQEYFLVDRAFFLKRPDLIQTGRTLVGRRPARHQQLENHYFGRIHPRVLAFMDEVDRELWLLGVPAKTRHNEASPAQFELAPVYEEQNLAIDHNMIAMQVLGEVAARHGLVFLPHEKPFEGVNGSGKHVNWSVRGPDGKNWLDPGSTPHENAKFLAMLCAVIRAVDTHAELLRAAAASAQNDLRLGANEAPPAILSIFLGDQLSDIVAQIGEGGARRSKAAGHVNVGVDTLPTLPRDGTDRNRTSPFAFTGDKFEFRAVGANMNCSGVNTVLNTIVAEAIDALCDDLEARLAKGAAFNDALQGALQAIVRRHGRILFDGDSYSGAWAAEAARRGLPNLRTTPEALEELVSPASRALFGKYGVFSERELASRRDVHLETYRKTVTMEAECLSKLVRTHIAPAAIQALSDFHAGLGAAPSDGAMPRLGRLRDEMAANIESLLEGADRLDASVEAGDSSAQLEAMAAVRAVADALESRVPAHLWPLPTYRDMFFVL